MFCHGGQLNRITILSTIFLFLTSCSIADYTRRSLMGTSEEDEKKMEQSKSHKNYVSMQQYDELLRKYEALRSTNKQDKNTSIDNPASALHSPSTDQILKELGQTKNNDSSKDSGLVDTVDVFDYDDETNKSSSPSLNVDPTKNTVEINSPPPSIEQNNLIINKFFDAKKDYINNNLKASLPKMKELERSSNDQVRVRALYYIGKIHMEQREYDLALQVFEELIERAAYSSYVLSTLKELVKCTEKLKLQKKRARYESLLKDVFGLS